MKRLLLLALAMVCAVTFRLWRYGGRWDRYNETYKKYNNTWIVQRAPMNK